MTLYWSLQAISCNIACNVVVLPEFVGPEKITRPCLQFVKLFKNEILLESCVSWSIAIDGLVLNKRKTPVWIDWFTITLKRQKISFVSNCTENCPLWGHKGLVKSKPAMNFIYSNTPLSQISCSIFSMPKSFRNWISIWSCLTIKWISLALCSIASCIKLYKSSSISLPPII